MNQAVYVDYMLYDLRGYHDISAEELAAIFRNDQEHDGRVGGYANWGVYTPGMLYAVAQHYLLSGDRASFERLLPQTLKALDWCLAQTRRAERQPRPGPRPGPRSAQRPFEGRPGLGLQPGVPVRRPGPAGPRADRDPASPRRGVPRWPLGALRQAVGHRFRDRLRHFRHSCSCATTVDPLRAERRPDAAATSGDLVSDRRGHRPAPSVPPQGAGSAQGP